MAAVSLFFETRLGLISEFSSNNIIMPVLYLCNIWFGKKMKHGFCSIDVKWGIWHGKEMNAHGHFSNSSIGVHASIYWFIVLFVSFFFFFEAPDTLFLRPMWNFTSISGLSRCDLRSSDFNLTLQKILFIAIMASDMHSSVVMISLWRRCFVRTLVDRRLYDGHLRVLLFFLSLVCNVR